MLLRVNVTLKLAGWGLNNYRVSAPGRLGLVVLQYTGGQCVSDQLLFVMPVTPAFFGAGPLAMALVLDDVAQLAQVIRALYRVG